MDAEKKKIRVALRLYISGKSGTTEQPSLLYTASAFRRYLGKLGFPSVTVGSTDVGESKEEIRFCDVTAK